MTKRRPDGKAKDRGAYRRRKSAEQSRKDSAAARDIGPLPNIVDPKRRERAERSFAEWKRTYFPERYSLAPSPDHIKASTTIETTIVDGGLYAFAMPRGSGKTTDCEVAVMFAACKGLHSFIALIGATSEAAGEMLESIRGEFEDNDGLAADYPEICYPIRALEGIANRRQGQTLDGERTRIELSAKRIVLPTVKGSKASGVCIVARGLLGRLRGMKYKPPNQYPIRPSLAIIDDCQTDTSAYSQSQCEKRERVISGAILGLAGPGKRIAAVLPCTIIRPNDVASRLLDREINPEWQGFTARLLYEMPARMDLWDEYNALRIESVKLHGDLRLATAFYKRNRKAMDEGAKVAWPERFDAKSGEISALQNAMNLRYRNLHAFECEYQNNPPDPAASDDDVLNAKKFVERINGIPRGVVPLDASWLTAFVDVHAKALYYAVLAFAENFTGYVVDYGTFPEQPSRYFTLNTVTETLARRFPRMKFEARMMAAFRSLVDQDLMLREYKRDDGAIVKIDRLLIDANWGDSTSTVYSFCRQSQFAASIQPSHGRYIGPTSAPIANWTRKPGELLGDNWIVRKGKNRQVKHVVFDSNLWATRMHSAFAVHLGDVGGISLYKAPESEHRILIDHVTSMIRNVVQRDGDRKVTLWTLPPAKPDNHLFDCVVGSMVAASMLGAKMPDAESTSESKSSATALPNKKRRRGSRFVT